MDTYRRNHHLEERTVRLRIGLVHSSGRNKSVEVIVLGERLTILSASQLKLFYGEVEIFSGIDLEVYERARTVSYTHLRAHET